MGGKNEGPWALWLLGQTTVSRPEGVSGGLSEKLAVVRVLEGMFFREGILWLVGMERTLTVSK